MRNNCFSHFDKRNANLVDKDKDALKVVERHLAKTAESSAFEIMAKGDEYTGSKYEGVMPRLFRWFTLLGLIGLAVGIYLFLVIYTHQVPKSPASIPATATTQTSQPATQP